MTKKIKHNEKLALVMMVAVLTTSIPALASDTPDAEKPVSYTSAEQKADLVLWHRSGAGELLNAMTYDNSLANQYESARQKYLAWRAGSEFAAEIEKLMIR